MKLVFYDRFVDLCNKKGVTPIQVRKDLKISQSTMASWKSRGLTPNAATVAKLAEYFGVSVDYLIGINPLPTKKDGASSDDQEFSAILNFLSEMGYVLLNVIEESAAAVILDKRLNQWYEIPIESLYEIERSITTFSKFQINEVLSNYTPMQHLTRKITPDGD